MAPVAAPRLGAHAAAQRGLGRGQRERNLGFAFGSFTLESRARRRKGCPCRREAQWVAELVPAIEAGRDRRHRAPGHAAHPARTRRGRRPRAPARRSSRRAPGAWHVTSRRARSSRWFHHAGCPERPGPPTWRKSSACVRSFGVSWVTKLPGAKFTRGVDGWVEGRGVQLGRQQGHPDNSGLGRVVPALFGGNCTALTGFGAAGAAALGLQGTVSGAPLLRSRGTSHSGTRALRPRRRGAR